MKKIKILTLLLCFTLINQCAFASKLPDDFWTYLKKQWAQSTQRFDSVVVLSDGTNYIPLYPAEVKDVKDIKVEYTYPTGRTLAQKPEVIIFNNNYVLLKLMKDKNGKYSITKNENLPLTVKMGVMPQDMLVPVGMEVPESLKIILGNLVIPQKGDGLITANSNAKIGSFKDELGNITPINELKDKKAVISTDKSKFVLVYDSANKNPVYELKLNGLPSEIIASNKSKYALVMYYGSKTMEVVDLANERVVTQINLEDLPKDAVLDTENNLAYVACPTVNTIYVVDLNSASLSKAIKLEQSPQKLALSNDGKSLCFVDRSTQKVYSLIPTEEGYLARFIAEGKNLSKLIFKDDKIYTISRTENLMSIYNEPDSFLTGEVKLNEKPTDALVFGDKIFILCSQSAVVDVFDTKTQKITKTIPIDKIGFYSKMTVVPNQPNALITGVQTKNFLLLNLDKEGITKKQNANVNVANIVIIDKSTKENL